LILSFYFLSIDSSNISLMQTYNEKMIDSINITLKSVFYCALVVRIQQKYYLSGLFLYQTKEIYIFAKQLLADNRL